MKYERASTFKTVGSAQPRSIVAEAPSHHELFEEHVAVAPSPTLSEQRGGEPGMYAQPMLPQVCEYIAYQACSLLVSPIVDR